MLIYIVLVFIAGSLLIWTCLLSLPKAFKAFDVNVSNVVSSLFLLVTVELRYSNFKFVY